MERKKVERAKRVGVELPRIVLSPYKPPTPEVLERRRRLGEEASNLREKIGPLGFSLTELIREDRESR